MNSDKQVPVVVLIPLDDERLETYREALFDRIDAPDVYEELTDPHITIHPGFTTTPNGIETIRTYLSGHEMDLNTTATAIYAYPDPDDPAVVAISVQANLAPIQEDIQHILNGYDHSIINEPSPPHITLLRRRDIEADDIPEEVSERVRVALDEMSLPSALQVGEPRVEWYNPPYKIDSE